MREKMEFERQKKLQEFTGANRENGGGTGVPPVFSKFKARFFLSVLSVTSC
jgi:hypothetical protein